MKNCQSPYLCFQRSFLVLLHSTNILFQRPVQMWTIASHVRTPDLCALTALMAMS